MNASRPCEHPSVRGCTVNRHRASLEFIRSQHTCVPIMTRLPLRTRWNKGNVAILRQLEQRVLSFQELYAPTIVRPSICTPPIFTTTIGAPVNRCDTDILYRSQAKKDTCMCCLNKNMNAPRPSEHPTQGENIKTLSRWDHRLQRKTFS